MAILFGSFGVRDPKRLSNMLALRVPDEG